MAEAAKTIYEKNNSAVAGITLRGQQGIHAVYAWGAFLWDYGGRYFDESGKLVVDSPEAIRGTQAYVDILNKYGPAGYANFGWQENRLLFQQGKAGMAIDATVNGARLRRVAGNAKKYATFGAGNRAMRSIDPRPKCAGEKPHKGRKADCGFS